MDKMPKVAIVTILILMIGLNFCVVYAVWNFFQKSEQMTFDLNRYLSVFLVISIINFVSGSLFMRGLKSYTLLDFCSKIGNSRTANNCILLLDQRKKEINDGIPDFVEVKIVTPVKTK